MNHFLFDASALAQRYIPEKGTALVGLLFARADRSRLSCLMLGVAEVVAVFARKRNGGRISATLHRAATLQFQAEVISAVDFLKAPVDNLLIESALPLLDRYAINSSDAILLRFALDQAGVRRGAGDDLVLVASDKRLLTAARAEGLVTFDPEAQPQADLDALLPP